MILYNEERDSPAFKQQFLKDYTPSVGMMFSEGVGAGFRDVSYMLAKSVMDMDKAENAPLLTEEDWKNSRFYDETIKWDESFTTPKARLLKERRDRERELGFLLDRAGMGATASFYAGALVGTVPDPVNYIPFVGILSKAKSAAVLAKLAQKGRLGRAVTSAADAAIGTAAYQFFPGYGLMAERETYQVQYDMRDALTDLGLALGVGFGLGAALGPIHPKDKSYDQVNATTRGKRVTPDGEAVPDNLPPAPVNTAAQRAWDSTAPTDKVDLLRRKIAADGAGVESNVPVPRQKGAERASRIRQPVTQEMVDDFDDLMLEKYGDDWFSTQIDYETAKKMGDDARVAEIEKTVDRKDLEKANELNEGLRATDRAEYEVSQREIEQSVRNAIQDDEIADELLETFDVDFRKDDVGMYLSGKNLESNLDSEDVAKRAYIKVGQIIAKRQGADFDALFTEASALTKQGQEALRQNVFRYVQRAKEAILAALRGDTEPIPDEVWNTPPRSPEPLPPVDDTPTKQNLKRVEAKEVEVETQLDNIELTDAEALMLAESNKEVEGTEKLMEAVRDVVPCLLTYG